MADDEKPKKSAGEKLYDRGGDAKAKPKAEPEKPAEPKADASADKGVAAKPADGAAEGEAADPMAELRKRHETERRDLHNQHRSAHRKMEGLDGPTLTRVHREQERSLAELHARHEMEVASGAAPTAAEIKPAEPEKPAA